jgi:hypothetical protein
MVKGCPTEPGAGHLGSSEICRNDSVGSDTREVFSMTGMDEALPKLVEFDLSEAVQKLRHVRFAEYFLIVFGFYLLTDLAGNLIEGLIPLP